MPLKIQKSELRMVFLIVLAIFWVSSLPYLFGYLSAPDDLVFMGIAYGTSDTTQYFSWLRGFQTGLLIDNHLTPEPNAHIFFNLQWWLLAQLERYMGLNHLQVFHLFRALAIGAFGLTTYWFIARYFERRSHRLTAFLLVQLGAGLGWYWVLVKYLGGSPDLAHPFDVYTIEPNSFLSQMSFPHFTLAAAFIITILGWMIIALEKHNWYHTVGASLLALFLGFSHAYDLLLLYVIIGLHVLALWVRKGFSWQSFWKTFAFGFISCWPALYSVYMTSPRFPVWHEVLAQFELAEAWTPDPFHLLFLMGIPFIMALTGYDGLVNLDKRRPMQILVRIWFIAGLFLIYFPVNFQIHYLNGWQIPIAILATETLFQRIIPWVKAHSNGRALNWSSWLPALLVLLVLPTNLYLFAWRFLDLSRHEHPYYINQDEYAALEWLEDNATDDQTVLSAEEIGRYVPGWTGKRSFLGHWAMTKDLHEKQALVRAFFNSDLEHPSIIEDFGVDYVLWGTVEQAMGDLDLTQLPYLTPCFTAPRATVFCVDLSLLENSSPSALDWRIESKPEIRES